MLLYALNIDENLRWMCAVVRGKYRGRRMCVVVRGTKEGDWSRMCQSTCRGNPSTP